MDGDREQDTVARRELVTALDRIPDAFYVLDRRWRIADLNRALGGEITVDSELDRGSTFTLWLPLPAASERRGKGEMNDAGA